MFLPFASGLTQERQKGPFSRWSQQPGWAVALLDHLGGHSPLAGKVHLLDPGDRDSPAEHEDGAGGGIVGQGQCLLQAQLLTAAVKAIRAVDAFGVVIAARAVLHGSQLFRALLRERESNRVVMAEEVTAPPLPLLLPSEGVHMRYPRRFDQSLILASE